MTATLTTPRLVLRPVALGDAPAIQKHFARWDIVQHLSHQVPWPYPPDGARQFIQDICLPAMARGEAMVWAITRREQPEQLIGLLDYRPGGGPLGHRGFWLAAEHQGQGYMTEAVTAFQDHVFFELGVERLYACNARSNTASRRVKEKTGARFLGPGQGDHHSGEVDSERWEITRQAWAALRGRD